MKEKEIIAACRPYWKALGINVENTAGGMYQSGLPDEVLTPKNGRQFWVEWKAATAYSPNLLRGRQKLVIHRWGVRGVPMFVAGPWWFVDMRKATSKHPIPPIVRCEGPEALCQQIVLAAGRELCQQITSTANSKP